MKERNMFFMLCNTDSIPKKSNHCFFHGWQWNGVFGFIFCLKWAHFYTFLHKFVIYLIQLKNWIQVHHFFPLLMSIVGVQNYFFFLNNIDLVSLLFDWLIEWKISHILFQSTSYSSMKMDMDTENECWIWVRFTWILC